MADEHELLPQDKGYSDTILTELQRKHDSERDMLIDLIGKYNNLKEFFLSETADIKQNFKDDSGDKKLILNDLDNRIQALENLRDTTNYPELVKTEQADHQWIQAYRISWKAYITLAIITGGVIGFILANILKAKSLFGL